MGVLDVEVSDFAKVEELFVKTASVSHATFADLVCHVVDELEAVTESAAIASKLGHIPAVAEYFDAMGIVNKYGAANYKSLKFNQIEECVENAKGVTA